MSGGACCRGWLYFFSFFLLLLLLCFDLLCSACFPGLVAAQTPTTVVLEGWRHFPDTRQRIHVGTYLLGTLADERHEFLVGGAMALIHQ